MSKRRPYEIRKEILWILREKALSFTQIQTKLSTNYDSVKNNCEELESYELVSIKKIDKHPENGQVSYDVMLTGRGQDIAKKIGKKKDYSY